MGREEAKRSGACVCHSCKELAALWEGVCCYGRKAVALLLRALKMGLCGTGKSGDSEVQS